MNKLYINIGKLIREKREQKELTQLQLAKMLGYETSQFVSLFERGLSKVPNDVLAKLIHLIGIDRHYIYKMMIEDYSQRIKKELGVK